MNKTVRDRILLVVTALVIVIVAKVVIDYNGGFSQLSNSLIKGGLDRICEAEPNNPECKAAQRTLEKNPIGGTPQPSPTMNSEVIDLRSQSGWNPQDACSYLSHISGLETRGYKNQYENTFGCSSPYKDLGSDSPLPNSIAYYVGGNSQNATDLKLVLNVNAAQGAKEAHAALLQYGDALTQKALNVPMPRDARTAISSGKAGEWTLAKATVELVRENWATGRGYELKYILRK